MFTIFTIPKPFEGHTGVIQTNAIRSWAILAKASLPVGQIVLCGDEPGVTEVAAEVGAMHLPGLRKTTFGTPLVSDAFAKVNQLATTPLLVYLNCDIVLPPAFLPTLQALRDRPPCLATAQRWTVEQVGLIDFSDHHWTQRMTELRSSPDGAHAMDMFVLTRNSPLVELPDLAVGRPGWDKYMLHRCRAMNLPLIDVSEALPLLHQCHGYDHVPQRSGPKWQGPEGDQNLRTIGSVYNRLDLTAATHCMSADYTINDHHAMVTLADRLRRLIRLHPGLYWPVRIVGSPILLAQHFREGGWPQVAAVVRQAWRHH